ncbi:MAG: PD40 domain-containing protein [Bacteroidetes bacterium]|nr:PD40 domain-containing protein [Bacteroidota bacterium]
MKPVGLVLIIFLLGCGNSRSDHHDNSDEQIESLDISPDDKRILLLSARHGVTCIFEIRIDGGSPRLIMKSSNEELYSNPRYSPDGQRIVFIKHSKSKFWEGSVFICNIDGTGVEELTQGGEFVTEALFTAHGNQVLYCSSQQYNTSKKKGTTTVRGFDIYSISLNDRKVSKLSSLNATGIDNLTEINDKYLLFHLNGKKSGIFSFEKENPTRVLRIFPSNGTEESTLLDKPGYVPDRFIVFTALYELYAMNLDTRENQLIYSAKGGHLIELVRGFHTRSTVLFKKFDEPKLTVINMDGSGLKSIEVEFPE